MDVRWRRGRVRKWEGGLPLLDDPALRLMGYAPPWTGFWCEHEGTGRINFTAVVVRAEQRGDRQINKVVYRLPMIRSCCCNDDFVRAAWWHDVDCAFWTWDSAGDPAQIAELKASKSRLLGELRLIVPEPSPVGAQRFNAFRDERPAESYGRDRINRAFWTHRVWQEQERRLRQRVRRQRERWQQRTWQRAWEWLNAHPTRRPSACLVVLGLEAGATLDQIKARHRALAMLHHPDRGGSAGKFREIQAAYEQAVADL